MANIEINYFNESGEYEVLYPATLGSQVIGSVASADTATNATKLGGYTYSQVISNANGGLKYTNIASQLSGTAITSPSVGREFSGINVYALYNYIFVFFLISTNYNSYLNYSSASKNSGLYIKNGSYFNVVLGTPCGNPTSFFSLTNFTNALSYTTIVAWNSLKKLSICLASTETESGGSYTASMSIYGIRNI